MSVRLVVAVLVLATLAAGLWWTASLAPSSSPAPVGSFAVFVVGPEGQGLANGTVVSRATPLDALQALAGQQAFTVEVERQPWIGPGCTAEYVVAIGGHRETVTGGWNYYTRQPGKEWAWGSSGAACHALSAGDQVEWCWVETDVCRHHLP